MAEYSFDFVSQPQRALYERFREQLRGWPWEQIRAGVREKGEYRLGLTRDLQPVPPIDPSPAAVSQRDQRAAWLCALLQVILREQHLGLARRADPESGVEVLWVTVPFGVTWRTAPRPRKL